MFLVAVEQSVSLVGGSLFLAQPMVWTYMES